MEESRSPSSRPSASSAGTDPSSSAAGSLGAAGTPRSAVPVAPPAAPRRKRRWLRVVGLLVVALLLLIALVVALIPTLASTSWARSMVVGKVNEQLNGRLEIADWSFGWSGNLRVDGVKVFDDQNRQILEVAHITGGKIAIFDALRGKYNLGKFTIDGIDFKAERDADGKLNFQKLAKADKSDTSAKKPPAPPTETAAKPKPAPAEGPKKPSKLPDVSVELVVSNGRGTYEDLAKKQAVTLESFAADLKIPTINDPIENSLTASARVNNGKPGTLELGGKLLAVKNNQVMSVDEIINEARLTEKVSLTNLDLASLQPFGAPGSALSQIAGISNGHVVLDAQPNQKATLDVKFDVPKFRMANLDATALSFTADGSFDENGGTLTSKTAMASLVNEHPEAGAEGEILKDWSLSVGMTAAISQSAGEKSVKFADFQIADSANLFKISVSDLLVQLMSGGKDVPTLQMVRSLTSQISVPSLAKLDAIKKGLSSQTARRVTKSDSIINVATLPPLPEEFVLAEGPLPTTLPATKPSKKADEAAPVVTLTNGGLTIDIKMTGDGQHLNVSTSVNGKDLAFTASKQVPEDPDKPKGATKLQKIDYAVGPVDFSTALVIATGSGASVMDQIHELVVSKLTAHAAGAEVALNEPLKLTDLDSLSRLVPTSKPSEGPAASLSAPLDIKGDLAPLVALMEAMDADEPGTKYPYKGTYSFHEGLGSNSGALFAKGGGDVTNFQVYDIKTKAASFTEPTIHLGNDVQMSGQSVAINDLSFAMQGSKALSLALKGKVEDLQQQRLLQGITADLTYDLAVLWKIIYPTLSPEDQKTYKDAVLTGQFTKHFTVSGSYPAGVPQEQAIRTVVAQGGFDIGSFKGRGIDLQNLAVPFILKDGVATIANSDKQGDYPKPAAVNSGQVSLAGASVDMTTKPMQLNTPENLALAKDVGLNPTLASALGETIGNFLFATASEAGGKLNITINKCQKLPLGKTMTLAVAENQGYLQMTVTVPNLTLASGGLGGIVDKVGGAMKGVGVKGLEVGSLKGNLKNYNIVLNHGKTTHELMLTFGENERPLHLAGDVTLATMAMKMQLDLPWKLLGLSNAQAESLAPNGISIPLTGTTTAPQFDALAVVQKSFGVNNPQDLVSRFGGLLNGGKKTNGNGGGQGDSPLGALGGLLGNKKDKTVPQSPPQPASQTPDASSAAPGASTTARTSDNAIATPPPASQPAADNNPSPADEAIGALQGLLNKDKDKKKKKPKKARPETATAPAQQ